MVETLALDGSKVSWIPPERALARLIYLAELGLHGLGWTNGGLMPSG